jgi:WXG100 family type VII secretion target
MSQNIVDYEALEQAATQYQNAASEISDLVKSLTDLNNSIRDNRSWQNKTSEAFFQKFDDEYVPAFAKAAEDLDEVAKYIRQYSQNRQDEDSAGAAAL